MSWIVELLLALIFGPPREDNDRSIVGKSRLDEEAERFWKWVGAAALAIAIIAWLIIRT